MQDGRLDEARTLIERARTLAPCYAYVHINLSVLEAREGRPDASLRAADEAVRCVPTLALAHRYRGDALERVGRRDEALAAYAEAVRLDPMLADAWLKRGKLLEARTAWADAAAAYDRATAAAPDAAEPPMLAGLVHHYRLGDAVGAVARYREVLRRAPTHYGAHYQLAVALLRTGARDEARAAWTTFERLARATGDRASIAAAPAELRGEDATVSRADAPAAR
jgi:tetratricopeptide (TPR) repeat protein